jgi:hypothetical protein
MKLQAQHSIPAILLLVSGVLLYLAKLPVEPVTIGGWATAVFSAIIFALQPSVRNAQPQSKQPNLVQGSGPSGSEQSVPAATSATGASGPKGATGA